MSQLFDALRRGRRASPPAHGQARPTLHGETVLATLGYSPARRAPRIPPLTAGVLLAGLALAGYTAWQLSVAPRQRTADGRPTATQPTGQTDASPPAARPTVIAPVTPPAPAPVEKPASSLTIAPKTPEQVLPSAPQTPAVQKPEPPAAAPPRTSTASAPPAAKPAALPPASASGPRVAAPPAVSGTAAASAPLAPVDDFSLALYYQRAGEFDKAVERYRAVLKHDASNAGAHNNLGVLYLDRGMFEPAVGELQRALAINPRYPNARLNLGVALMRQNKADAAAAEFRALLAHEPENVDAMVNLALAERASSPEPARELLLRALSVAPRHAPAHYNLAVLYDRSGEAGRALEHYRAFLAAAAPEHSARASEVRARVAVLSRQ